MSNQKSRRGEKKNKKQGDVQGKRPEPESPQQRKLAAYQRRERPQPDKHGGSLYLEPKFLYNPMARAILDWKASRLDMWLSDRPHLVGGPIMVDASRGVLFDTDFFVRWVYALLKLVRS